MSLRKHMVVSLHDYHPGSHIAIEGQIRCLEAWGVKKMSILVIPEYHHGEGTFDNPRSLQAMEKWLDAGHELIAHGYYHDRRGLRRGNLFWTRLYTANEAEFLDLDDKTFEDRAGRAKEKFERLGWPCEGFIAPGWLMPKRQDHVLANLGFTHTCRVDRVVNLKTMRQWRSRSLCYSTRAKWRVFASLRWNPFLFSRIQSNFCIRVSLHPRDFEFQKIRDQVREMIAVILSLGYRASTYADVARDLSAYGNNLSG